MGTSTNYQEIASRIEAICNDREHGASFLAKEALHVLAMAAELSASPHSSFITLKEVSDQLARSRPAMAAIKNMVHRFLAEMERTAPGCNPYQIERGLLSDMDASSMRAAHNAAQVVCQDGRVLTCSYSSVVLRTFRCAQELGRAFSVLVIESMIGGISYGRRLLNEVMSLGISAELVQDDSIAESLKRADLVLVGADAIVSDGSVVNGWPSRQLAELAQGILPFYVVGESFKRAAEFHMEEGFDLVPASLITMIITD